MGLHGRGGHFRFGDNVEYVEIIKNSSTIPLKA